jgi:hypothetical protein
MTPLIDRLFIGGLSDCGQHEGFAVICACRSPCWTGAVKAAHGLPTLPATHPDAVAIEGESRLILNLPDLPTPSYTVATFERFLAFATAQWKAGKSLLIHGVRGESRPAALATLFRAKVLGDVPNDSFENARAASVANGIGAGLTAWLGTNWHKIPQRLIAHLEGAAPEQKAEAVEPSTQEAVDLMAAYRELTPENAVALAKGSPLFHFAGFARIRDKNATMTPVGTANKPSLFQLRACAAYEWLVANKHPVRLILGPKPRQSYGSTISAEICQHHSRRLHFSGMMIGDEGSRTDLIWQMFNSMAKHDRFGFWDNTHESNQEKATFTYQENGKPVTFDWLRDTASDEMAGSSGTRQILWFSEVGKYGKEGKVTDKTIITNAMNSIPPGPDTLVIMESVSGGPSGYFYEMHQEAVTLEERINGQYGNGWVKVFCAWHEVPDYRLEYRPEFAHFFNDPLDDDEKIGAARWNWTAEQIAWRRETITRTYSGDVASFQREYPASVEEAFHAGGTPKFCPKGLARLETMALAGHDGARLCVIEKVRNSVAVINNENPWLWLREEPLIGCRYLVFGDYMTGEQSKGSKVRDTHAVGVWRDAYMGKDGVAHPPRLAAAIFVPQGCRWDSDIIADRTMLLSKLYGNCLIGIEVNEALGVLALMQKEGANLWRRKKEDETVPGQTLTIPGWKTTPQTRKILIDTMAKAIREQEIEVQFGPMVKQLRLFQSYPDGSCAAPPGELDDFVLGGAIGLTLLPFATELAAPRRIEPQRYRGRAEAEAASAPAGWVPF